MAAGRLSLELYSCRVGILFGSVKTARCSCPSFTRHATALSKYKYYSTDNGYLSTKNTYHLNFPPGQCYIQHRSLFGLPNVLASKKKEYSEKRIIGYSMDQMYEVVADVDDYKEFVPWCRSSQVIERSAGYAKAKLVVGFPPVVERYTSILTLVRPNLVQAVCVDGELFSHMKTVWKFSKGPPGQSGACTLDFHISFEFKSVLHSHLSTVFFDEVVKKMVKAFEKRCQVLYGPSVVQPRKRRFQRQASLNSDVKVEST